MSVSSPFKFLDAYGKEDKEIFFGRDGEIEQLYELVFESNMTLVYGQSGTGKTSLIQCGLANRFAPSDWFNVYIRRNEDINTSLLDILKSYDIKDESGGFLKDRLLKKRQGVKRTKVEEAPEESELVRVLRSVYKRYFKPIYLIFDQFEELFILGNQPEQDKFYRTIARILETETYCNVIIIMREESIAQLYDFERLVPFLFDKRLRIEPMSRSKTSEVITKTTAGFGIALEDETVPDQIIELLSEGKGRVELTYLQVFLDQLYQEAAAKSSNGITFDNSLIQQFGNIENVLGDFLEKQTAAIQIDLEKKSPGVLSTAVTKVLGAFVSLEGTKRPLNRGQLKIGSLSNEQVDLIIDQLEKSRILRLENDRYELMHDSLALQVARQRSAEEVSLLQIARIVRDRYLVYETTKTLLNNNELQLLNTFRKKIEEEKLLSDEEWTFIRKSAIANRRRRILLIIMILAIIGVLVTISINSYNLRIKAEDKEQEALDNLEKLEAAQREQRAANYDKYLNEGIAQMAVSHYADAIRSFETAIDFDSLRQEARDSLMAARNKIGVSEQFTTLITEGDELYARGDNHLYIDALSKYQAALELDFNPSLAQSKIDATKGKLEIAFDQFKERGDINFRAGGQSGFREALWNYQQAQRIRPGDAYIRGKIQECEEALGQ